MKLLLASALLTGVVAFSAERATKVAPADAATIAIPEHDIRLRPEFVAELSDYKRGFQLPEWARQGRARQIRFDGGPLFAACQFESGWNYLTDPKTPGFVGMIRSVWTLTNLYTDDIGRRLDEISAAGYNWVWVSYQLGYAVDDETRQRAQVRRLIQLAHARGIRVTAYFSLTSIFTASSYSGVPESKGWSQENADGSPVAYSGIPIRLMACVNKPGRLEYLKKIVRLAAEDGADDIFWDSVFNRCYCSSCDRKFREYSRRVLGNEQGIPKPENAEKKKQFDIDENYDFSGLNRGATQALFTEFGHYTVARAIADLDRTAKSVNPQILVSANSHRFRFLDDVTDVTWSEDSNSLGGRIDEKGRLTTPVGIYQWCQAVSKGRKPIQLTVAPHEYWQLQPADYYRQTVADAASFQGNFVMLGGYAFAVRFDHDDPVAKQAWNGIGDGLNFVRRNASLYEDAKPIADVGLYYSYASRIRPGVTQTAVNQWLDAAQNFLLAGIPTEVITDQDAVQIGAQRLLSRFKAIVLAGASCLSNEEIELFRRYISAGGKLLVTKDSGTYTSFWTKRSRSPWSANVPGIRIATDADLASSASIRTTMGEILRRPPLLNLSGTGYQMVIPSAKGNLVVLHVINYSRSQKPQKASLEIAPADYPREVSAALSSAKTAMWLTPDHQGSAELPISYRNGRFEIALPELRVSGVLVLGKRSQ